MNKKKRKALVDKLFTDIFKSTHITGGWYDNQVLKFIDSVIDHSAFRNCKIILINSRFENCFCIKSTIEALEGSPVSWCQSI